MIWQQYTWTDEMLQWENRSNQTWPDVEFYQLELIYIPVSLIWVPDVVVFNVLEKTDIIDRNQVIAKVYKNGTIRAEFPQVLATRCTFDISDFPFDTQNCTMTYGSWSLPSNEIFVTTTVNELTDLSGLVLHNHPEWDIIAMSSNNRNAAYLEDARTNATGERFSELDITLTIQRKPAYYIYVLIVPTFVISLINTIGLFSAKREREDKVTMGLTTLLTMAIILTIVTNQVPKSQLGLPLLGDYVLFEILISSAGIIVTNRMNEKYQEILDMLRMHLLRVEKHSESNRQKWILEDQWARVLMNVDLIMMILFIIGNVIGTLLIIFIK
uniref:Neurotransmitter-gated ion-channel ligand-binding domain-containing protein n=1 Tax=Plectus sambesii TaxID=2011161 RepID=A0A914VUG6_9BILA